MHKEPLDFCEQTVMASERSEYKNSVPLIVRDDGFSMFFTMDPTKTDPIQFAKEHVDYLQEQNVSVKEFGLGPGSVFTYRTNVGEMFGEGLTKDQCNMLREGDRRVIANIKKLVSPGRDALSIVTDATHAIGRKIWARLEMNHEYGPASENNWMWVAFVGRFNKDNPQYRITDDVRLDFVHEQVRAFKLAILREALEHGVDGLSLDFCVYPPFLSDPLKNAHIMTAFMKQVRAMMDAYSPNRRLELIVRVPYDATKHGLAWSDWMDLRLIDGIIPSVVRIPDVFDVPVEPFVEKAKECGCKVYGCIRPCFGRVTTDESPTDRKRGIQRREKPITKDVYYAKALLLLTSGVDGIQIALGSGNCAEWHPFFNDLGDRDLLAHKSKEYYADRLHQLPAVMTKNDDAKTIRLRIVDKISTIRTDAAYARVSVHFYARGLLLDEELRLSINDQYERRILTSDMLASYEDEPIENPSAIKPEILFGMEKWWDIGKNTIEIPSTCIRAGYNDFTFAYTTKKTYKPVTITDFYVQICKQEKAKEGG